MKKVFIDVGCHEGYYSFIWTKDPNSFVYAFEPVPSLYNELKKKESLHSNFKVFNYAICEVDGESTFNINTNLATCSLKDSTETSGYVISDKIVVKTKRLDTFCKEEGIDKIFLMKSDAQGSDLEVVKSLGEKLKDCDRLLIEAWITPKGDNVYEDEVKKDDLVAFLSENNFELVNEAIDGNYADLTFQNLY
jgi:FkbM family methyltransferase